MITEDYNKYRQATLKPLYETFKAQVKIWEDKVERTRKGSEKQREIWLQKEIDTLDSLKALMTGFEQVIRVLKEEVENNEVLHMAQTEEIVRLTEEFEGSYHLYKFNKLVAINNAISKMIIEQDLN